MAKLTPAQKRDRARRAFRAVFRETGRLSARIERLFPSAVNKPGYNDPAPEVIVGLGQACVYAGAALALSDDGLDNMLQRHALAAPSAGAQGRT